MSEPDPVIACTLPESERRARREELRRGFASLITGTRELEDGVAFRFSLDPETEQEVRAFAEFESRCCAFAEFDMRRDQANGVLWLDIRGPEGTREFVSRWIPQNHARRADEKGQTDGEKRAFRFGLAGLGGGAVALICCATPALPFALGLLGLAGALSIIGGWLDAGAWLLLVASCAPLAWAVRRRLTRAEGAS